MEKIVGNNLKTGDVFLDPNTEKPYRVLKELEATGRENDSIIMTLVALNLETNIEETFNDFRGNERILVRL